MKMTEERSCNAKITCIVKTAKARFYKAGATCYVKSTSERLCYLEVTCNVKNSKDTGFLGVHHVDFKDSKIMILQDKKQNFS